MGEVLECTRSNLNCFRVCTRSTNAVFTGGTTTLGQTLKVTGVKLFNTHFKFLKACLWDITNVILNYKLTYNSLINIKIK